MTFTQADEVPACRDPENPRDPELWFPTKAGDYRGAEAKVICKTICPVRERCLAYAVEANKERGTVIYGIWGGKDFTPRSQRTDDLVDA